MDDILKRKFYIVQSLTVARIPLILVFFIVAVFIPKPLGDIWFSVALSAMILSAVTDLFDGFLARKFGLRSRLGAYIDPLCDKVFYLTT